MKKIGEAADENFLKGDEETAYVLYMKFFTLITSRMAANHRPEIVSGIGGMVVVKAVMDRLEMLKKSLTIRYDQKHKNSFGSLQYQQANAISQQKISEPAEIDIIRLSTINSEELFKKLKEKVTLLIDVRKKEEFEASSIMYTFCLNIPGDQIKIG